MILCQRKKLENRLEKIEKRKKKNEQRVKRKEVKLGTLNFEF